MGLRPPSILCPISERSEANRDTGPRRVPAKSLATKEGPVDAHRALPGLQARVAENPLAAGGSPALDPARALFWPRTRRSPSSRSCRRRCPTSCAPRWPASCPPSPNRPSSRERPRRPPLWERPRLRARPPRLPPRASPRRPGSRPWTRGAFRRLAPPAPHGSRRHRACSFELGRDLTAEAASGHLRPSWDESRSADADRDPLPPDTSQPAPRRPAGRGKDRPCPGPGREDRNGRRSLALSGTPGSCPLPHRAGPGQGGGRNPGRADGQGDPGGRAAGPHPLPRVDPRLSRGRRRPGERGSVDPRQGGARPRAAHLHRRDADRRVRRAPSALRPAIESASSRFRSARWAPSRRSRSSGRSRRRLTRGRCSSPVPEGAPSSDRHRPPAT